MNEKLQLAEEWLLTYPASSQEFEAALEHVRWEQVNGDRVAAQGVMRRVLAKLGSNPKTAAKLTK